MRTTSTITRLAAATTIALGLTAAAAPAFAQGAPDMPTLSYPTKDGPWGCRLTRSCKAAVPAPTGPSGRS